MMRSVIAVAGIVALCAAAPALAQEADNASKTGIYGNLGWSGTDTHDAWSHAITGRLGARFGRYLGIEGELSGGLSTGHYTFAPGTAGQTDVGMKQSIAGAGYAVGFLPVAPNFDLLARVGYGASRYNLEPNGQTNYHVSEHGVRYGAGAQYFFDGSNGLRADYTRQHMDGVSDTPGFFAGDRNANVWSVTFAHKF
jgi:hypothetical protein